MKFNLTQTIIVVVLVSFVTSNIVYFGFVSNYSRSIFAKESFTARYTTNVFKYRVLSRTLLLRLDTAIDKDGKDWYTSVFYLNTFFLILTSVLAVLLVDLPVFSMSPGEKVCFSFLVPVVINLSQFCVVPYDTSSYFFQLLILYIFLRFYETHFLASLGAILILIALSTANRESSAISVAFLALISILKYGMTKKAVIPILLYAGSFLLTYILLRELIRSPKEAEMPISTLAGDLTAYVNILGLLFWVIFGYFSLALARTPENSYLILLFHLFCLPYIFTVFTVGILWEVRLYIPLFLSSLFLSKIDMDHYTYRLEPIFKRFSLFR